MSSAPLQKAYNGKTILITGAMGYIGSALVQRLSGYQCRIIMSSRLGGCGHWEHTPANANIEAFPGEVTDADFWQRALESTEADTIFHFAGQNSVYAAAENPMADFAANVAPVINLAEAIRAIPKKIDVLYSGTATVVGMSENLPVGPDTTVRPVTIYDQHKLMAEQYLELYARMGDLRAVTLRLANVYGPGISVGSPDRGILNKVIAAALDGKPVSIFGKGDTTRDYIYIDDVIDAFAYAGAHMEKVNGQHYYLGTGTGHSVKEAFTLAVAQATAASGRKVDISHVSWPDGLSEIERRSFVADIDNLRKATGWCPKVDLAEGIKRTIATFLAGGTA